MRKLLYLFLLGFCLFGCHDNRFYLDKVEALWNVDADSMRYYLLKVDSASLTLDERLDYNYYRLGSSYRYLLSQEKSELDSTLRVLEEHYPKGHIRAFNVRLIGWTYCFHRLKDIGKSDSLLVGMKSYVIGRKENNYEKNCSFDLNSHNVSRLLCFGRLRQRRKRWNQRTSYQRRRYLQR